LKAIADNMSITIIHKTQNRIRRVGAATVEFAIVIPFVILFFMAAIEFTRISLVRHVVDNASYEAARNIIVPGASVAEAEARAQEVLDLLGVSGAEFVITPTPVTENTPSVTVTVTVPISENQWVFPTFSTGEGESCYWLLTDLPS